MKDELCDLNLWFLTIQDNEIVSGAPCRAVAWEDPEMGWDRSYFT